MNLLGNPLRALMHKNIKFNTGMGGLNKNGSHIFEYFMTREWYYLKGLKGFRRVALLKEVCYWGLALRF